MARFKLDDVASWITAQEERGQQSLLIDRDCGLNCPHRLPAKLLAECRKGRQVQATAEM
jgi:hypothetical protein